MAVILPEGRGAKTRRGPAPRISRRRPSGTSYVGASYAEADGETDGSMTSDGETDGSMTSDGETDGSATGLVTSGDADSEGSSDELQAESPRVAAVMVVTRAIVGRMRMRVSSMVMVMMGGLCYGRRTASRHVEDASLDSGA